MVKFKVIKANDESEAGILASMHHLRYKVFHQELKWSVGLRLYNCMEFDEYDTEGTHYIVRINDDNQVDATCRLMPTSLPYMLAQHYPHFISTEPVPKSENIWEFSRACASPQARKSSNGTVTAQLIAAAIEFGLVNNVSAYVSLTTDNLYPMLRRIVGWDSTPMGEKHATPDDSSFALKHTASLEMLSRIRTKNKFQEPFVFKFDDQLNNIEALWHDNSFVRKNQTIHTSGATRIPAGNDFSALIP